MKNLLLTIVLLFSAMVSFANRIVVVGDATRATLIQDAIIGHCRARGYNINVTTQIRDRGFTLRNDPRPGEQTALYALSADGQMNRTGYVQMSLKMINTINQALSTYSNVGSGDVVYKFCYKQSQAILNAISIANQHNRSQQPNIDNRQYPRIKKLPTKTCTDLAVWNELTTAYRNNSFYVINGVSRKVTYDDVQAVYDQNGGSFCNQYVTMPKKKFKDKLVQVATSDGAKVAVGGVLLYGSYKIVDNQIDKARARRARSQKSSVIVGSGWGPTNSDEVGFISTSSNGSGWTTNSSGVGVRR